MTRSLVWLSHRRDHRRESEPVHRACPRDPRPDPTLQAELAAPSPCPPDPAFATELTLAAQDVLSRLVAEVPGITNPTTVSFGLGSAAIGAGSAAPGRDAELESQLEADVQAKWDDLEAGYPDVTTGAELIETARTAQKLGMMTLRAIPPGDVLLVLGGQS